MPLWLQRIPKWIHVAHVPDPSNPNQALCKVWIDPNNPKQKASESRPMTCKRCDSVLHAAIERQKLYVRERERDLAKGDELTRRILGFMNVTDVDVPHDS